MGGERPFDDDRWPDQEGFACCFLCGKKVDPLDPHRGLYTPNVRACDFIPIHLPCADDILRGPNGESRLLTLGMAAVNQMSDATIRKMRRDAALEVAAS